MKKIGRRARLSNDGERQLASRAQRRLVVAARGDNKQGLSTARVAAAKVCGSSIGHRSEPSAILGTLDLGLYLYWTLRIDLTVYSDVDWAGRLCSLPWGQSYFLVLQATAVVSQSSAEAVVPCLMVPLKPTGCASFSWNSTVLSIAQPLFIV